MLTMAEEADVRVTLLRTFPSVVMVKLTSPTGIICECCAVGWWAFDGGKILVFAFCGVLEVFGWVAEKRGEVEGEETSPVSSVI
jgi:hypothetical protein